MTQAQTGANAVPVGNEFVFRVGSVTRIGVDLINPPPLEIGPVQIERFLQFVVPPAIQIAAASIQQIPLPSLQGFAITNVRLHPDGQQHEFITVEGDVR